MNTFGETVCKGMAGILVDLPIKERSMTITEQVWRKLKGLGHDPEKLSPKTRNLLGRALVGGDKRYNEKPATVDQLLANPVGVMIRRVGCGPKTLSEITDWLGISRDEASKAYYQDMSIIKQIKALPPNGLIYVDSEGRIQAPELIALAESHERLLEVAKAANVILAEVYKYPVGDHFRSVIEEAEKI